MLIVTILLIPTTYKPLTKLFKAFYVIYKTPFVTYIISCISYKGLMREHIPTDFQSV